LSNDKKDLTRIEDLGEFLHELNAEEEPLTDFSAELPDLPVSDHDADPFATTPEETPEEETIFGSSDFGTSDFESSTEETFVSNEEPTFGSSEFESLTEETFAGKTEETTFGSNDDFGSDFPSDPVEPTKTETTFNNSWDADIPLTEKEEVKPEPVYTPSKDFKTPETFEDLKKFSESSSFTGMATEGNPSYSVLVKNVRFIEDINDIIILLKELNLLSDPEEQVKGRLMRGMLLIPRVSEYAAIFLAHKLRRFDIDIQVGLSDEIHPPKHQEAPETGIVSKFNLFQNQTHHFHFDDPKLEISQIIVAATQSLEGYQVLRYMGVASEHKMLDSNIVEDEGSDEVPRHYQELAQKLKAHALKAHSNAVVGLNYQLSPIPSEFGMGGHKYRLTCTGNLVWVNKL
jgi:hypothetical protein